ncbi:hypothetical protein C8R43DRAFT_1141976 [Mycena crocata]|nr:hypothetical protein C8R43DRAFT_1141976 [Mycena crocata]
MNSPDAPDDYVARWLAMSPEQLENARRLIGQSGMQDKRAQEKRQRHRLREAEHAAGHAQIVPLYHALGWATPDNRTDAERLADSQRRNRRDKREQHERLIFARGRAHEREVFARSLPPAPSATRIRSRAERERRMRIRNGAREPRELPLTIGELYVDGVLPPVQDTTRKHQQCSLCNHVKCLPVSYLCGHSHCYACIRLHLETDWRCPQPQCERIMQQAPFRHEGEEESLRLDYPNWCNTAQVSYSFDGLTFPVLPKWQPGFDTD